MRIALVYLFLCAFCGAASAQENPVIYRARCGVKPATLTDLETAMTRGLRYFVQANGIPVSRRAISVQLIPAVGNQRVYTLRKLDLQNQWSIGEGGVLNFNSLSTDKCSKSYRVKIDGLAETGLVGAFLNEVIEVGGAYERILSTDEKVALSIKRRSRR